MTMDPNNNCNIEDKEEEMGSDEEDSENEYADSDID